MIIIKPPSLAESFDYIYSRDPALEYEREGFDEAHRLFKETGDIKHIEPFIKDDQEPSVWRLGHLRGKAQSAWRLVVAKTSTDNEDVINPVTAALATALSLRSVKDCEVDGAPLEIKRTRDKELGVKVVTEDQMYLLAQVDGGLLIVELGMAALIGQGVPEK